ncbi:MAG TPA: heavy metal-responsive transcriptional regulator [Candidatus Melainabacteria bacterium]|jgi:MerR family copper efflux transcriptional regulator|nr:heavy metal-responsive transcriptional regulator [Candidatus Melainabacteria bacterium]HIA54146.1 heavy metal-responsive transcriptional regulator [Candidatus Melainabacteria bacterium]HIN63061.1 heavy metal-responsive transcriptional regulator [Candidatus Obscuribacterales bacterium]
MNNNSLVGMVAKQLGVSSQTIHWYETQGLIPPPERTESGYRVYQPSTIEQLRFVRKALGIGFSVDEIRAIIDARRQGNQPCEMVLSLLQKKIDDVNSQIETLIEVQDDLKRLQKKWLTSPSHSEPNTALICPLIEEIDDSIKKVE